MSPVITASHRSHPSTLQVAGSLLAISALHEHILSKSKLPTAAPSSASAAAAASEEATSSSSKAKAQQLAQKQQTQVQLNQLTQLHGQVIGLFGL